MSNIDKTALYSLSYGLFVLGTKDGEKDNGCIVNTVMQVGDSPLTLCVSVNKLNLTAETVKKTGEFTVSVLSETAPFGAYRRFGFASGRDTDKWKYIEETRLGNGIRYLGVHTVSAFACRVTETLDTGSHLLFLAEVTEAIKVSDEKPATYAFYHAEVKPKAPVTAPAAPKREEEAAKPKGHVCKICGFVYEGDELPEDFVCPLCKHPASDFEPLA